MADFLLTCGGLIPGEIDLQGYDMTGSLTRRGMIPRGVRFSDLKFNNCKFLTKIENILTHWSVAKAGLNNKKGGRKSRWTVPLKNQTGNPQASGHELKALTIRPAKLTHSSLIDTN